LTPQALGDAAKAKEAETAALKADIARRQGGK
jgi:hypothetical protein